MVGVGMFVVLRLDVLMRQQLSINCYLVVLTFFYFQIEFSNIQILNIKNSSIKIFYKKKLKTLITCNFKFFFFLLCQ